MLPTLALLKSLRSAFRTYILAQLVAPQWGLIMLKAPFVPSPDLLGEDITPDFDMANYPLAISDSAHFDGRDPATGDLITLFSAGAGVEMLISTSNVPRTLYGWCILGFEGTVIATKLLPTPLNIVSTEDGVLNPEIGFHLPMNLIR